MMRKAREWPEIKRNNAAALEKLSLFLHECENIVNSLDVKGELVYAANIKTLVNKLPYNLREKWRNKVDYIEEERQRSACFKDLVEYGSAK